MAIVKTSRLVGLALGVGVVPVVIAMLVTVFRSPERSAPPVPGGGSSSGVALSSPIDPDARFFWQLEQRPPSLVPLDELISGGPPPDGIPAIDAPVFEDPAAADAWLADQEPVVAFQLRGDARAYPLQILTWHEIVNDVVGGEPVTVSFCPLCNTAIVFSRRVAEGVLDFGTSGLLYRSDLVMYDRQTKSLWPQIEGRAVVGSLMGTQLQVLPASIVSWREWLADSPTGRVLSRNTGFSRNYGENPYRGYDTPGSQPFLFSGDTDPRLDAVERVLAAEIAGASRAYPFTDLAAGAPTVVHDEVGGTQVVVFFARGTASALDSEAIRDGRDVGATGLFRPALDKQMLRFEVRGGRFVDVNTSSTWNLLGRAVAGPLAGRQLEPIPHVDTFWFAWAAYRPDTELWRR